MTVAPETQRLPARGRSSLAGLSRALDHGAVRGALRVGPLVAGLVLWATGLGQIDLERMTDLGLISVLPAQILLALALLTVGFVLELASPRRSEAALVAHVLAAVIMLYAIPSLVEAAPRFSVTWRHAGIANYIMDTGTVDPGIDAYFNWPGFFVLLAFVTKLAGYSSAISLAGWAPVFFNLVWLPPLVLVLRSATSDRRLVWLGVWLFYLNNWIGQDYLSPQGLSYFMNLVILAVLLRWFGGPARNPDWKRLTTRLRWPDRVRKVIDSARSRWRDLPRGVRAPRLVERGVGYLRDGSTANGQAAAVSTPAQRAALIAMITVIFAAMVASHQLTPFSVLGSVAVLVLADRCRTRGLPVLMFLLLSAWVSFMTVAYLTGHIDQVTGNVGKLDSTVNASVGKRINGSVEHQLVVRIRIAMALLLWGLAAIGTLRQWRAHRLDPAYALLAIVAFPLAVLQPYGGEIFLRIALFALPFMALFAAACFIPSGSHRWSWPATGALLALSAVMVTGFLVARYGNERMDHVTQAEVDGVRALYRMAPRGSELISASSAIPWRSEGYDDYEYKRLTGSPKKSGIQVVEADSDIDVDLGSVPDEVIVRETALRMSDVSKRDKAYLIITRGQKAHLDMFGPWERGALARLERVLASSPRFRVVYSNPDTRIFTLAPPRRAS